MDRTCLKFEISEIDIYLKFAIWILEFKQEVVRDE